MARIYFWTGTDLATAVHNAGIEKLADRAAPPAPLSYTVGGVGTNGKLIAAFTTAANEPDAAQWPTGDYDVFLDVLAMDSTMTYGLLTQGATEGHFARVDGTLDVDLEAVQDPGPAFSTPGLKAISFKSQAWAAGAATDRAEVLIAGVKVFGMGNDSITLNVDGDGRFTGPWQGGGAQIDPLVLADAEVLTLLELDAELAATMQQLDAEVV